MLPQGNDNKTVIEVEQVVSPHKHYASDIINLQSRLDGVISQIKGLVPTEGDTLEKLYNLLISSTVQIIVPNIEARDALDIQNTFTNVFVLGEGNWELYKAVSVGTNASFVKLSDSKMLNDIVGVDVLTKAMLPLTDIADNNSLVLGNDVRLTDDRNPLPHKHSVSNITGIGTVIDTKIKNALDQKIDVSYLPKQSVASENELVLGNDPRLVEALTKSMLPLNDLADANNLVMGNDVRLTDNRYPLPHKHNVSNITGVESLIDTKINNKVSTINVGVLSINSKTGNIKLQKLDVGLDFVDNTPDNQKPVSIPQKAALDKKINISSLPKQLVAGNNELVLGNDPRLTDTRRPQQHTHNLRDISDFSASVQNVLVNLFDSTDIAVSSVNGKKGSVTLSPADVGLKFVNNTSDIDKPVSKHQRAALDLKISTSLLPVADIAEPDQLVLGSDPRLKNARTPLPHTSDLITDFDESVTSLAKSVVGSLINLDVINIPDTTNLAPGEYTKVVVNARGNVISGSHTSRIHELGVEDVYTKSEIDTKLTQLTGPEPNKPGGPAIVNEFGKLPDVLLPESIQTFEHAGHFPFVGNKSTLYIDELNNTLYVYNGTEYVKISTDAPETPVTLPELAKVSISGDYNDLENIPNLSKVSSTGNYYDLMNIPILSNIATSGNYYDLIQRPTLSNVATSGSYDDLIDKPTYQAVATSGSYLDLHNSPDLSQYVLKTEETRTKTLNFVGNIKPITGTARWYPERDITLLYAYLTISDTSTNRIVCEVNMNSVPISSGVILESNTNNGTMYELNTFATSSDYITVNIMQADDGRNLTLTIVYR